jgi:hypothetical protein
MCLRSNSSEVGCCLQVAAMWAGFPHPACLALLRGEGTPPTS